MNGWWLSDISSFSKRSCKILKIVGCFFFGKKEKKYRKERSKKGSEEGRREDRKRKRGSERERDGRRQGGEEGDRKKEDSHSCFGR